MNIYDISKQAGVSIATVSRVLNGARNVREPTRERVLSCIEKNGYTPNAFARGLGLNSMRTIGMMCADSADPYLAQAISLLEGHLRTRGYDALLCCTGYTLENRQKGIALLMAKRVDAILLVGSNHIGPEEAHNDYIRKAAATVPLMLLNGSLSGDNLYSAVCEDETAMYQSTQYLLATGCKQILFLYNAHSSSCLKKLSGYRRAVEMSAVSHQPRLEQFFEGQSTDIHAIRDFLLSLREKKIHFDAVLATDDGLAVGALKYAKKAGLQVPRDLSVFGFNDSSIARCCEPELTSVDSRLPSLCEYAVHTLTDVLSGKISPKVAVFSGEPVFRETTRPLSPARQG